MTAPATRFINRELSWLEFNQRVLDEAADASVPLLERLKFLAITGSNLDEFFMVRVGGLQMLADENVTRRDPSGLTPAQQLEVIAERVHLMAVEQDRVYRDELEPALAEAGVRRVKVEELSNTQILYLEKLYRQETSAVVTPMAVNLRSRFPLLRNLGLHLALRLFPAKGKRNVRFAVTPLLPSLDRFVTLPGQSGYQYILVEDMLSLLAGNLFPGERVAECVAFRITRNADMRVAEDSVSDLLAGMQEVLQARKRSACVRLEVGPHASRGMLSFLRKAFRVNDAAVYLREAPLDVAAFMSLASIEGFQHLKYETWPPQPSSTVDPTKSMFTVLARTNLLLFHPYDSFEPVLRLIEEASTDPDVLAIKQALYRTSRQSPVIEALKQAARNGKYVTVLVELKARFDEARNIEWALELEQEGVQVIYGVKRLKTHSKVCIVVRREPDGIVRYLHFGTGNYNEITARLYSDVSYMTCDADLGADASAFFNAVAGYSTPQRLIKLDVAPIGLREKLLVMIEGETERRRQGQKATILAKMNSLVDPKLIEALYRASQVGVEIRLNVRGVCCLRPGVEGLSENISVTSIVDRFLEHARIFYFRHGGEDRMYISSADWMPRNLDRRVELLVPVDDLASKRVLLSILDTCFHDTVKARHLLPDGGYVHPADAAEPQRSQETFYRRAREAALDASQPSRTVFKPHRRPDATD